MSFRPLLLLLSFIGTILTGSLDLWTRSLPLAEASEHFKLTVTIARHDLTDKVQKALAGLKIPVTVKHGVQTDHFTKNGFRVVYQNSPDVVQAIYKGLRQSGENVSVVVKKAGSEPGLTSDASQVQYGGVYPGRPAAVAAQKHLEGKAYVFKVVDNYRKAAGKTDTLEAPALSTPEEERCKQLFKELKLPESSYQFEHAL